MKAKYFTNAPLEAARDGYLEELVKRGFSPRVETIPVASAAGRLTAAPVYAVDSAPGFNACAMDGVALSAKLTAGATLEKPAVLKPGRYVRVGTGDPLPDGCDAVVMFEDVTEEQDGSVGVMAPAAPWQHIRQVGEDMCAGEMALQSYSEITPAALGALLACGVGEVAVIKRPVVGIVRAGDGAVPRSAGERGTGPQELNTVIFSAMLAGWGAETSFFYTAKDDAGEIKNAVSQALEDCDAVIVCADGSADPENSAAKAIAGIGEIICRGIAIKPGKPAILGICGNKPVLAAPAYPVSGIIVVEELLKPILEYLGKRPLGEREYAEATLSKQVVSADDYREFVRVGLGSVGGKLVAMPLSRGSGVVSSFMKADGIAEVPQGHGGFKSGESVTVRLLKPRREIEAGLVAIGSHDPLLDELSDLLRRQAGGVSLKSSHVGSMGGLMAIRRGEAHIAGVHLLDETTGEYNAAFIAKYFQKGETRHGDDGRGGGGVRLVSCAGREQGLMLQKGNPKGITSVLDVMRDDVGYVNRQKGSGTRILFDFLCRREGVSAKRVTGYGREEFTHTSVAAIIASGSADAGLGILSAARMYDLDFLHICDERYDLLIPDHAWEMPLMQRLLEILKSKDFAGRLERMGGYKLEGPGDVILRI